MIPTEVAVIGCGNMGGALLRGLLRKYSPAVLCGCDDLRSKRSEFAALGIRTTADIAGACSDARVIVLAVKPLQLRDVVRVVSSSAAAGALVISVAAGVSLKTFRDWGLSLRLARVMPNLPCVVGEGAAAIFAEDDVTANAVEEIFGVVAKTVRVEREELLDAVTAVAGSGPGFFAAIIEALVSGAARQGLPESTANLLAAQTMLGTAKLILERGERPSELRDRKSVV